MNTSMNKKLHALEQTGNFVFHGSPHILSILEPRQAQTIKDERIGMVNDGEPAVATSPFANVAIFRSLINSTNISNNYTSSFSYRNGTLLFTTNQKTLDQARECTGYVYMFNKSDFEMYSPMEYRSLKAVRPIEVIEVTFSDLPEGIEIQAV